MTGSRALGWIGVLVLMGCGQVEDIDCRALEQGACKAESRCAFVGVINDLRDEVGACRQRCDDGTCPTGSCVGNVPDYEDSSSNVELAVNACLADGE